MEKLSPGRVITGLKFTIVEGIKHLCTLPSRLFKTFLHKRQFKTIMARHCAAWSYSFFLSACNYYLTTKRTRGTEISPCSPCKRTLWTPWFQ